MVSRRSTTVINRYSNNAWRVVTIILTLIGFLFFLWPNIIYNIAVLKAYTSQSAITIGLSMHEVEAKDIPTSDINAWQKQYLARHKVPFSLLSLDYIYVPENLVSGGNPLCVAEIKITSESSLDPTGDIIYLVAENVDKVEDADESINTSRQDLCLVAGKNLIFPDRFQVAPVAYSKYIDPYFYPFDIRVVEYNLSSQLYYKTTRDTLDADTQVLMSVSPPRWIPDTKIMPNFEGEKSLALRTTFNRFPLFRVLSLIVPMSIFSIIIILPRIRDEVGSFWEVIVGLILGLWGLSEVLIPSYIDYPTIIETIILFLYFIIGLFVIGSVVRQSPQRENPLTNVDSLSGEIPDNESIENLFLWGLQKLNDGIKPVEIAEALFVKARDVDSISYKKKLIDVGEKIIKA